MNSYFFNFAGFEEFNNKNNNYKQIIELLNYHKNILLNDNWNIKHGPFKIIKYDIYLFYLDRRLEDIYQILYYIFDAHNNILKIILNEKKNIYDNDDILIEKFYILNYNDVQLQKYNLFYLFTKINELSFNVSIDLLKNVDYYDLNKNICDDKYICIVKNEIVSFENKNNLLSKIVLFDNNILNLDKIFDIVLKQTYKQFLFKINNLSHLYYLSFKNNILRLE